MMKEKDIINKAMKMSDILFNNYFLVLILERFEIKLGLYDKTVEYVCKENGVNIEVFLTILNLYTDSEFSPGSSFNYKDLQSFTQYLKNSHKYYIEEVYPKISNNIQLMYKINNNSEILMVDKFFKEYIVEVEEHFNYENNIVFPYITKMFDEECKSNNKNEKNNYSVKEYKEHHDDIEVKLTDLKNLLIKYLPQKKDGIIRRKILFSLFELEHDLNIHSRIEDNILIPLVEKMESERK